MKKSLLLILIVPLIGLVSACESDPSSTNAPSPSAKIGIQMPLDSSVYAQVEGFVSIEEATFFESQNANLSYESSTQSSAEGHTFYVATVELFSEGDAPWTRTLNLSDASLADGLGNTWIARAVTFRGDYQDLNKLIFYKGIGADGQTGLDFGIGFTGMDMTMTEKFPEFYLQQLHIGSPTKLTFLFEIPTANEVQTFKLWSLPDVQLK